MKNSKINIQATLIIASLFLINVFGFTQTSASVNISETIMLDAEDLKPAVLKLKVNSEMQDDETIAEYTISNSDNFRYTSLFNEELVPEITELLMQKLGTPAYASQKSKRWFGINGETVEDFKVILKNGKLKIKYFEDDPQVVEKIDEITKAICKITLKYNCK